MTRKQALDFLLNNPAKWARMLGFTKLRSLHNDWIVDMVRGKEDETLQASRGTYKTTCVSLALSLIIMLLPNYRTMFMRKTDNDIKEVVKQVQKILEDPHTIYLAQQIYPNINLTLLTKTAFEVSTNLTNDIKGTSQLVGMGIGGSLTGKHFDRIFTDDIVNVKDRISKAEREQTKIVYQELQNIKNRSGRIFNTGTPWHAEDCFSIMPKAKRFNCYHPEVKKIITAEELAHIKSQMLPSLFAANYELRFIASENVIFTDANIDAEPALCEQGLMQIDSAFYGEDYTAWCIMQRHGDKYYVYGDMRRKHVEDCYDLILNDYNRFMCKKVFNETNADKGMICKELRSQGMRVVPYHEDMNKFLKIVTYLKKIWKNLYFVKGTNPQFIQMIEDYYEDAEHDDAPDSVASLARVWAGKSNDTYNSLWMIRKE